MTTASPQTNGRAQNAHRRAMIWSLVLILAGAMIAPLSGYVYVAYAQDEAAWETNPRAETWRDAREGEDGYTAVSGPYVTDTLIQTGGENWRNLRNGPVASITPWFMAISLLLIGGFHAIHGGNRIDQPLSGKKLLRWRLWERVLHWFTAISFIILAITGLSLLFGRAILIPLLGHAGFAVWAEWSKLVHNYLGPVFTAAVLVMIIAWVRYNIPKKVDFDWFRKGGGMGKQHASAGRMNGGEKAWFWFIVFAGGAVCVTGLILDFPGFGQDRGIMQIANLIHATIGIAWIALSFGHIYIGTAGTEGAIEGMATGYVSDEWAAEHHDLWLEQLRKENRIERPPSQINPGPISGGATRPGSS